MENDKIIEQAKEKASIILIPNLVIYPDILAGHKVVYIKDLNKALNHLKEHYEKEIGGLIARGMYHEKEVKEDYENRMDKLIE